MQVEHASAAHFVLCAVPWRAVETPGVCMVGACKWVAYTGNSSPCGMGSGTGVLLGAVGGMLPLS